MNMNGKNMAAEQWINKQVAIEDLNRDMFRDYDYRKTNGEVEPAIAFRLGLTWAKMAIEKAARFGIIENRKVVLARDAREIKSRIVDALISSLRYVGLDVIYIASKNPNCASSYSWAVAQINPLMGIFITSSHVTDPAREGISGFKVGIQNELGRLQSLTTKEIKSVSLKMIEDLINDPSKIKDLHATKEGELIAGDVDAGCIRLNILIGCVAASREESKKIYDLARDFEKNKTDALGVMGRWEKSTAMSRPFSGFKVVIEAAHTPSGYLAAKTFEALGARTVLLHGEVEAISGDHKADPSKEKNLIDIKKTMKDSGADFGIAFDLDGDRGAIIIPTKDGELRTLPSDAAMVTLLPFLVERAGYDPKIIGKVAVVRDVLATKSVDEMAEKLGIRSETTDAGYVFLKAKVRELERDNYTVPIYSERSGHSWLDVTGPLENPIAFIVLFAVMTKEYMESKKDSKYPFEEIVMKNMVREYRQSTRFQPLYHPSLLSKLSKDPSNNTGWDYEENPKPPQIVIALGRDAVIRKILEFFTPGKILKTPAGPLKAGHIKTCRDSEEDGGLYRFADMNFSINEVYAGRFVFRASSNDPTFVCSFETPVLEGESRDSAAAKSRYDSVGGSMLDWLEARRFAVVSGANVDYPNKADAENALKDFRMAREREDAAGVAALIHTPLDSRGVPAMAKRYLEGGYKKDGYGVEEGAAVDGSFAIGSEGNQGYYVDRTNIKNADGSALSGKDIFLGTVDSMNMFFARRAKRIGKPIKYVIKPGIGGQHTPFQGIADSFEVIDAVTAKIVGEYELGKDYEKALGIVLKELNAAWDQIAVIPSSKSGSTDETMMIFSEILYVMFRNIASEEGIDGQKFARIVFNTMHEVNFVNGVERPGKDLFNGFNLSLVRDRASAAGLEITYEQVKSVFGKVLGNMFFETTDRPEASRLSAFIRNSGLDRELGEDAPGFGAMFDNVGGRWTADLHMMTFLAYHNLNAESYWNTRYEGIKEVRDGKSAGNTLGDKILDESITDIALVVPDELFWFGKAMEQNFNESIWQNGFANLVAVKQSMWGSQKKNYTGKPERLVINISELDIPQGEGFNVVDLGAVKPKDLSKQRLANALGKLFTLFYGMTYVAGNRLIVRALADKGYTPADVDINDLDNPATKIAQENLYLRQPYVELGKGLLEARLKELQQKERETRQAIETELNLAKKAAEERGTESNIPELAIPAKVNNTTELTETIKRAVKYAKETNRKFVPLIYLEGVKFYDLRDYLTLLGIEWVMQGTGDQHISYQQILAQPRKYLPFIISFVPERALPGRPAIGFAKGYLDNVSPNMVRDLFAEASYKALTELRKEEGGRGIFMRMIDSKEGSDMAMLKKAFVEALIPEASSGGS